MKTKPAPQPAEVLECVERFLEDCIYQEETGKGPKSGVPSMMVYIAWTEWAKLIAPTVRLSFFEFNSVLMEFMPDYISFKDSDGVAAWLNADLTQIAHLFFHSSRLGMAMMALEDAENKDDDRK